MDYEVTSVRVNITCHVSGVFPHPDVRILVGTVPIRHDGKHAGEIGIMNFNNLQHFIAREPSGDVPSYAVTIWKIVEADNRGRVSIHNLGCDIRLPGTGYRMVLHATNHHQHRHHYTHHRQESQDPPLVDLGHILVGLASGAVIFICVIISFIKLSRNNIKQQSPNEIKCRH